MTLLGGLGTIFGPVVGAFVVITLEHYLAQLGAWVTVVQGAIFVVCVLTFRRGIAGELERLLKRPWTLNVVIDVERPRRPSCSRARPSSGSTTSRRSRRSARTPWKA